VHKYGHAPWDAGAKEGNMLQALSGCFATHITLRSGSDIITLDQAPGSAAALPPRAVLASANCAGATAVAVWRAAASALGLQRSATAAAAGSGGGPRVLVWGGGLLGQYAGAEAALRGGAALVCTVDIDASRLALAQQLGATHAARVPPGSSAEAAAAAIRAACPPGTEFDAVLEVCGSPDVVAPALALLRPGGVLVLAGMVHPHSSLAGVTGEAVIRRCASIVGVHNYRGEDLEGAIELLRALHARGAPWEAMFSPPVPLHRLPEALEYAKGGRWARVVVEPSWSDCGEGAAAAAAAAAAFQEGVWSGVGE
jgi:D-arabinose 1-dehydrogenase-like Zn-dependent alcohol dehydrogenase